MNIKRNNTDQKIDDLGNLLKKQKLSILKSKRKHFEFDDTYNENYNENYNKNFKKLRIKCDTEKYNYFY